MLIKDRYEIKQRLGSGASSEVFLAFDKVSKQPVAIKKISLNEDNKEEIVLRLQREYRILSQIDHPNILRAYDCFFDKDCFFMVTEYIQGLNLEQVIIRHKNTLSFYDRLVVAQQLTKSLEVINALGIVHRDIKPSNIMLDSAKRLVKILDLGTGKKLTAKPGDSRVTKEGTVVGTPSYMSPEQIKSEIYENTDVFSCAVTLYQFFSWTPLSPFERKNLLATLNAIANEDLPALDLKHANTSDEKQIYAMIAETLSFGLRKDPAQRTDVSRFAAQFQKILEKYNELRLMASGIHNRNWTPGNALSKTDRQKLDRLRQKYGDKNIIRRSTVRRNIPQTTRRQASSLRQAHASMARQQQSALIRQSRVTQRISKQRQNKQQELIIYAATTVAVVLLAALFFLYMNKISKNPSTNQSEQSKIAEVYNIDTDVVKILSLAQNKDYENCAQKLDELLTKDNCSSQKNDPLYKLIVFLCNKDNEKALGMTAKVLERDYSGVGLYVGVRSLCVNAEFPLARWYGGFFAIKYADFRQKLRHPAIEIALFSEDSYTRWKNSAISSQEKELYRQYMILNRVRFNGESIDWDEVQKNITNDLYKEVLQFMKYCSTANDYEGALKKVNTSLLKNFHYPWYRMLYMSPNKDPRNVIYKKQRQYRDFVPFFIFDNRSSEQIQSSLQNLAFSYEHSYPLIHNALHYVIRARRYFHYIDLLGLFTPGNQVNYLYKQNRGLVNLETTAGLVVSGFGLLGRTKAFFERSAQTLSEEQKIELYWYLERLKVVNKLITEFIPELELTRFSEQITTIQSTLTDEPKEEHPYFFILGKFRQRTLLQKLRKQKKDFVFYRAVVRSETLYRYKRIQKPQLLTATKGLFDQLAVSKVWHDNSVLYLEYIHLILTYYKHGYLPELPKGNRILQNEWFLYIYNVLHNKLVLAGKKQGDLRLQKTARFLVSYANRVNLYYQLQNKQKMQQDIDTIEFFYPFFKLNNQNREYIQLILQQVKQNK